MKPYIGMFDVVRDGAVAAQRAEIPDAAAERARHLKAAGYYFDASMMGICAVPAAARLETPIRNPQVAAIASELERSQPRSFAAGMDMILADVVDSARAAHGPIGNHTAALVVLVEYPRDPRPGEPGCDWIHGTQAHRSAVLAAQTAVLLASYLRLLGFEARSHTATCTDVCLNRLAVAAGLAHEDLNNPYLGRRYGLAAVTTTCELEPDEPLAPAQRSNRWRSHGPAWQLGIGTLKGAHRQDPYAARDFHAGPHAFETLRQRDEPTTFIDHERVPRFPKRADFFARALFGDLGKDVQDAARNAYYVMKSPIGACARRALGALLLLQFGDARADRSPTVADPQRNARNLKGAAYYLGSDAVGLCAVPPWAYYSHDAGGNPMPAYHAHAVNVLIDQGHETMEGASGDDWISVAQSMRAYLRFSLHRRHRRRADPPPRLRCARALGARRRRAAAAAAAAERPRRGQPHRRSDPQPLPRAAASRSARSPPTCRWRTIVRSTSGCSTSASSATSAPASARRARSPPARRSCSTATRSGSPTPRSAPVTASPMRAAACAAAA